MNAKKTYTPAKVTFIAVHRDDVIRTSGGAFDGPGDPLFPKLIREYFDDPDAEFI